MNEGNFTRNFLFLNTNFGDKNKPNSLVFITSAESLHELRLMSATITKKSLGKYGKLNFRVGVAILRHFNEKT